MVSVVSLVCQLSVQHLAAVDNKVQERSIGLPLAIVHDMARVTNGSTGV